MLHFCSVCTSSMKLNDVMVGTRSASYCTVIVDVDVNIPSKLQSVIVIGLINWLSGSRRCIRVEQGKVTAVGFSVVCRLSSQM
jgi:hypothetical protein